MPIYEYRCSACGHQQEFLQKVSDPAPTTCPQCGAAALSKMLTAAGFQLKGSGWYATDFRNKGAAPAKDGAKDGAKADAKGESKSEGKGDSKGEAKTESKPSGGGASAAGTSTGPAPSAPASGSDKAGS